MVADSYVETSSRSWFQRLRDSVLGIFLGIILLVAGSGLLWINEAAAINAKEMLRYVKANALSLPKPQFAPANNGKLVHLSGEAVGGKIGDNLIVPIEALLLRREVQMYQWMEDKTTHTERHIGGGETSTTSYNYKKDWSDKLQDSSAFRHPEGHGNPKAFRIQPWQGLAPCVKLGDFTVSSEIIESLGRMDIREKLDLKPGLDGKLKRGVPPNTFFFGADPANPAVGDLKISYFYSPSKSMVSILAGQNPDRSLVPFQTPHGEFEKIMCGSVPIGGMIADQARSNKIGQWGLRLMGLLLILLGFHFIFKLIVVMAGIIPFMACLAGAGSFGLSLILSILLSLGLIIASQFYYQSTLCLSRLFQ